MPKDDIYKTVARIGSVIGGMISIFVLLNFLVPTSLIQPIAALVIGLIITGILVKFHQWTLVYAVLTWALVSVGLIGIYLIISRPVTVIGALIKYDNSPAQGIRLVLTDSSGVDHKTATDAEGRFEFGKIPQGRYTISIENGRFLNSGSVPSGIVRLWNVIVAVGQFQIESAAMGTSDSGASPAPTTDELARPQLIVEQLGEKFSQPGDLAGAGGNILIISIPQRTKVVVHTNLVQTSTQHLWMFICIPDQNEASIQCNARELTVTSQGVFNGIVTIGRSDEEGQCELLDVGFAIVENAYNDVLESIPMPMLKSSMKGHFLIEDWYQVKRGLKNDGSDLNCVSEEAL